MTTPSSTEHSICVLLIDDQPMVGEAVRRMLADDSEIRYHYCQDPRQAFERIQEHHPTVILQDLVMPQMNGMDLVREFRQKEETREIPLIVLSTKEDPEVKAEGFASGANDYLVKLPDKIELIARIRYHSRGYINLLQRNEAYEELRAALKDLEVRNQFIRKTFGRYLTDDVVENLLESPDGLKVGGERREVTILMTDLRGFSSLSERLKPEQVVSLLNIYLGTMTDVILKYEGTIDEFIGDAILVVFGAPIQKKDHAERAVACAVEMQLAMALVNQRNQESGFPEVEMGIGINTGEVVVGNIGSEKRAKYGVVGRDVNLASRIETYSVGGQILTSQQTYEKVASLVKIRQQMKADPKGAKEPITIFDVVGMGEPYNLFLQEHQEDLTDLIEPLKVQYTVLDGKSVDRAASPGTLIRISLRHGIIRPAEPLELLCNLRLQLEKANGEKLGQDVYAKVIEQLGDEQDCLIRFTSVPDEAKTFLLSKLELANEA